MDTLPSHRTVQFHKKSVFNGQQVNDVSLIRQQKLIAFIYAQKLVIKKYYILVNTDTSRDIPTTRLSIDSQLYIIIK